MTKKEIVKAISEELNLPQLKTKEIVQKTFDAIIDTLVRESRIELRNFGVFEVKKRAARKARNPRTGDPVEVAEKYVVTFKPGKEMEERVRQMEEEDRLARTQENSASAAGADPTNSSSTPSSYPQGYGSAEPTTPNPINETPGHGQS
ncbi:HU family DNA-binding protein [Thalassoroseus pseudoceratinae]|uniref:HU family DNA-binding protein n=1 Tax=Thalassoroseus pseudoceratinae TaxID=2713176 RepID=UPI001421AC5E